MPLGIGIGLSPALLGGLVVPDAPTSLTAVQDGADVDLTWTDNASNNTGYYVYRSSDGVSYSKIATIGDVATYTDTNPGSGIWYYYVAAYNGAGETASNVATIALFDFTTLPDGALPDEFTGATWAIASGVAINTPTEGSDVLGVFGNMEDYTGTQDDGTVDTIGGWINDGTGSGDLVEATATVHAGTNAAKVTFGNDGCRLFRAPGGSAVAGLVYRAQVWTRGDGSVPGRWFLFDITNGASILPIISTGVSAAAYQIVKAAYVAPPNTTRQGMYLYSPASAGVSYFDDASIFPLTGTDALIDSGQVDVSVSTDLTVPVWMLAGLSLSVDDPANIQNAVRVVLDRINDKIRVWKWVAGTPTLVMDEAFTYSAGATLLVKKSGTTYKVFYDSVQVGSNQTISDAGIVNNDYHGLFSADSTISFDNLTITANAGDPNVVAIGGSITSGSIADPANQWFNQVENYIEVNNLNQEWNHINSGSGGTESWYGLIRLQTDVIDYNPSLIFVDFAVNDSSADTAGDRTNGFAPAAEALLRRLITALPNAKYLIWIFTWPDDYSSMSQARRDARDKWIALANHYSLTLLRWDTYLESLMGPGYTDGDVEVYLSAPGSVHPDNDGHDAAYALAVTQISDLNGNAPSTLPARYYAEAADYEYTPIIRTGTDNDAETGTGWSTVNTTERQSSTADDTIAWTGTFCSFGLQTAVSVGQGVVAWSVDGGAYTNIDLSLLERENYKVTNFTRGVHTVTLKIVSGTVTVKRFLAV